MKTPRLRRTLNTAAVKRTSRRRLIAVFAIVAVLLIVGFFLWYLPHRPSSLLERAIVKSLKQQSVSFTVSGSGSSVGSLQGQIDRQGDSLIEIQREGQRISIITADGAAYISGDDKQWLKVSQESAQALLSGQPPGLQPTNLKASDRRRLEGLYDKHSFIGVDQVFDEAMVDHQMSYHYRVKADKKQLRAFLGAAQKTIPDLKLQTSQITTIMGADLLNRSLDVWIGKADGLVHQVAYAADDAHTVQIHFNDYGKVSDITKPQSSAPLLDTLRR